MQIPKIWRDKVCAILFSCDSTRITITRRARLEWEASFPSTFLFELYMAMAKYLSNEEVEGNKVEGMVPPGEVYEFFFTHELQEMYGKVNLLPSGQLVIIYSAHIPLKGDKL